MIDKKEFIDFLIANSVLKFGDFTTKSGRKTPYFINTGEYNDGKGMQGLAEFYAESFKDNFGDEVTNLFGPAYKGIPLCVATSMVLDTQHKRPISFTYNRKEAKDHGEGGSLVGNRFQNPEKVVIIEDVITAGTSVRETLDLLKGYPHIKVVGLLVSVDRMEKIDNTRSALQQVEEEYGIKTASIANIDDIIEYLENNDTDKELLNRVYGYRKEYGA